MDAKRLTGVKASSLKYDLLTALSVAGLHLDARHQISLSRLLLLITARYNWRLDEFCVGQRDLARMWNVTERTVKREIKFWTEKRMVICKRQGVRGRVGAYRLNYPEIYRMSEPYWDHVGPDFSERMVQTNPVKETKVVAVDFRTEATANNQTDDIPATENHSWRAACKRIGGLFGLPSRMVSNTTRQCQLRALFPRSFCGKEWNCQLLRLSSGVIPRSFWSSSFKSIL